MMSRTTERNKHPRGQDAMEHLLPHAGSYGSAGDGSRAIRKTRTGIGVATNPAVRALVESRSLLPVVVETPSADELRRAVRDQQCCFCLDNRTFRSLSGHWARGHGINLQEIRDILGVPKRTGFVSKETQAIQGANAKRHYDRNQLHPKSNHRDMSAYGQAANRAKLVKARTAVAVAHPELPPERAFQIVASEASVAKRTGISKRSYLGVTGANLCKDCGQPFYRLHAEYRQYCTPCLRAMKSKVRKAQVDANPHIFPIHACVICGVSFQTTRSTVKRQTCPSQTCLGMLRTQRTRERMERFGPERLREINAKAQATRAATFVQRYCGVVGCNQPYVAKGLCGKHYQQSRSNQ